MNLNSSFSVSLQTMAVFKAEVQVRELRRLTKMPGVDAWRVVERYEVTVHTKYGACSLILYNTHQPSSKRRPWHTTQQIDMCKAVVLDAIRFCSDTPDCVGYGFGGDANTKTAVWTAALAETPEHRIGFQQPTFMYGLNNKAGDLMVGAGRDGLSFADNDCAIQGMERQHDPMIMEWCYRAHISLMPNE